MAALGITVLKNNVPWGPFSRTQVEDGLSRGDFTVKYLAHAPGLKEWLPLGEVLDYVERNEGPRLPALPPVPSPRELPPVSGPLGPPAIVPVPPLSRPPILPEVASPVPVPPAPAPAFAPIVEKKEDQPIPKPEINLIPASFFPRGVAFVIDCAILFVPVAILFGVFAVAIPMQSWWGHTDKESLSQEWQLLHRNFVQLSLLVAIGLGWLYAAGLECSPSQATVGKWWMGIKVTDTRGERVSFLRATVRYATKYLSALPCFLGFIMALFSSRGLALHDRVADTRVVRG